MAKPGRNDPCHCGSGKKYKKCCQPKDDEAERAVGGEEPGAELQPLHKRDVHRVLVEVGVRQRIPGDENAEAQGEQRDVKPTRALCQRYFAVAAAAARSSARDALSMFRSP